MIFGCGCWSNTAAMVLSSSSRRRCRLSMSVGELGGQAGGDVLSGEGDVLLGRGGQGGVGELGDVQGAVTTHVGDEFVAAGGADLVGGLVAGEQDQHADVGQGEGPFQG